MVRKIDERRRVKITVSRFHEETGEKEFQFSCLFDRQGRETGEEKACPADLKALFSSLAESQPPISGAEERKLVWKGKEFSLSILRYIHMTLGELLDVRAAATPDREAAVDCGQNRRFTYRELKEASDALALSLIHIGLEKGDKVAVIMDNCWENILCKVAVEKAGGITVNLNIHEKGEMLERLLKGADVKILLVRQGIKSREHMDLLYEICPELRDCTPDSVCCSRLPSLRTVIVTDRQKPRSCAWQLEDLMDEGKIMDPGLLAEREKSIDPLNTATILHTSGSSGIPKGVMLSHAQLIENALSHVKKMGLTEEDRFCMTSPMFHALGCIGSVLASMEAGCTLVFHGSVRCTALLDVLRKEQCTVLSSVPTIFIRLLEDAREKEKFQDIPLRLCVTAGASCPGWVFRGLLEKAGVDQVLSMYGMTEAGPGISSMTIRTAEECERIPGGEPWPGVKVQIRRPSDGKVLDRGESGEICVRSYSVMQGYYGRPEETARAVDPDGWLHTGDMGCLSEEGRIFLSGRCKDLIIRGGENISPGEIETLLCRMEQVEEAAVVGAPDPQLGETVFAFLRLKTGETLTLDQLRSWCQGKIATIKIPEGMAVVKEIPVKASGKADKAFLREQAKRQIHM